MDPQSVSAALGSTEISPEPTLPPAVPLKRGRGRPRKNKGAPVVAKQEEKKPIEGEATSELDELDEAQLSDALQDEDGEYVISAEADSDDHNVDEDYNNDDVSRVGPSRRSSKRKASALDEGEPSSLDASSSGGTVAALPGAHLIYLRVVIEW